MNYHQIKAPYFFRILSKSALVAALVLAGCGGGDESAKQPAISQTRTLIDTRVSIVDSGFEDPECMNWTTYGARDGNFFRAEIKPLELLTEADGNGYAVSRSPWWIDPNHGPPGAGFLNLIAIAYYDGFYDVDAEIKPLVSGKPLDLRDATVTVRWRAPTLATPPDSKLVLWFQTRAFDPVYESLRYVNYALTGQPLEVRSGDSSWQVAELALTADPEKWTCLGSNDSRTDLYGCATSIDNALATFEADLGFVILSPDEGSSMSSTGAVEFDSISMLIPPSNRMTHARTLRYMDTELTECLR